MLRKITRLFNPIARFAAGHRWFPLWAIVEHRGRTSGRIYEIPVVARKTSDGFVIPLPFGPATSGRATSSPPAAAASAGRAGDYDLTDPKVVDRASVADAFNAGMRAVMGPREHERVPDAARGRLALVLDLSVEEDHRGTGGRQRAARGDRLVEGGGGDDDDVGAVAGDEAASVEFVAPRAPGRGRRRGAHGRGSGPRPDRRAACRPASADPRGGPRARDRAMDRRTRPARPSRTRRPRRSARAMPRCSCLSRPGRPTTRAPAPRPSRRGRAGRSPRSRTRRTGRDRPGRAAGRARSGHERDAAGGRCQDVERGPDRGVADGVDLGGDAVGGGALAEFGETLGFGDPHAATSVWREVVPHRRLEVGEEPRRPRPERTVGEALLPADPGTARGIGPEHVPAADPAGDRGLERVVTQRGEDADGQRAGLGQAGVGRVRPGELRVRRERPRVVGGDDTQLQERAAGLDEGAAQVGLARERDERADEARRRLVEDTFGGPVGGAADDAADRVGRRRVDRHPPRVPRDWPATRGGRAPRARRGDPARRLRCRRRSASGPSDRRPSRGLPATPPGRGLRARHGPRPSRPRACEPRTGPPGASRARPGRGGGARRSGPGPRPRRARGRSAR